MLFILTGDIQIGKTRWLQALCSEFEQHHICVAGIISPGIWKEKCKDYLLSSEHSPQESQDSTSGTHVMYEKQGIQAELLPQHELIPFALRRDLAQKNGDLNPKSQSSQAKLGWEISEEAIVAVNDHFDQIEKSSQPSSLLVIDELGQLELKHNGGFTQAIALLKRGPSKTFPHALVVVRNWLVPDAKLLFAHTWKEICVISPNQEAKVLLGKAFNKASY